MWGAHFGLTRGRVWMATRDEQVRRLRAAVATLPLVSATELVEVLAQVVHPPTVRQITDDIVNSALRRRGLASIVPVEAVIEAMCLPAAGRVDIFPGARRLLSGLAARGRVVIVSNTLWRRRAAVQRDFTELGLAEYVSDYVMSIDVGWRKPHTLFFDAALAAGGEAPERCILIGDSETNDIAPAHARGIGTIRVAIEAPRPMRSAAQHTCASLDEATDLLPPPWGGGV